MNSVGDDKNLAAISFEDALRELEADRDVSRAWGCIT